MAIDRLPLMLTDRTITRRRMFRHCRRPPYSRLTGFLLVLMLSGLDGLYSPAQALDGPKQVLFVGNSYFYYNDSLHNHVRRLAQAVEGDLRDYRYRSVTISGGSLAWHPLAHYLSPGALGYKKPFDAVVLQGNSGAALSADKQRAFTDAVKAGDALIRAAGAKTVLYMTHAYARGHKRFSPDMTARNEALISGLAREIGAQVAPVALAFDLAYQRKPDLALHQPTDHSHPSLAGTYLAACVVYQVLYGQNAIGNAYDYDGRIDQATAAFLQQVAADAFATYQAR